MITNFGHLHDTYFDELWVVPKLGRMQGLILI